MQSVISQRWFVIPACPGLAGMTVDLCRCVYYPWAKNTEAGHAGSSLHDPASPGSKPPEVLPPFPKGSIVRNAERSGYAQ
jgi:hypothetical protein